MSHFTITYYLILCHVSLALALPTNNSLHIRAGSTPDLSGAAGKIAGAAFALILISFGFGLGAATIAIAGSIEWREFRDRNKPDEEKAVERVETRDSEDTIMEDKEWPKGQGTQVRRPRVTLKSFMPVDFRGLKAGRAQQDTNKT